MTEPLTLKLECGEDTLEVRSYSVTETMNTLFEAIIVARSPHAEIDLGAIVNKPGGFSIGGAAQRAWTGIVSRIGQAAGEEGGKEEGWSTYRLHLVPVMFRLTLRKNNRIFERMSVPDIVGKVLDQGGIEYTKRLRDQYETLDYCVQYAETDFAFVSRLLERSGISYYFQQVGDGDEAKSVLVLDDAPQTVPSMGPLPLVEDEWSSVDYTPHVRAVVLAHGVAPGQRVIRDFDFRRPDFVLLGQSAREKGEQGAYEQYDYQPGLAKKLGGEGGGTPVADDKGKVRHEQDLATTRARVAGEAHRTARKQLSATTSVAKLWPGTVFSIDGHPHPEVKGKDLIVFGAQVEGTVASKVSCRIQAAFAAEPMRPAQVTPRARVPGLQTAIVVGPAGKEIHTDEFGRVRLKFPWDREGNFDDDATCWVRVSQNWAGPAWGAMLVPRIGHEVVVDFQEGNPDEPIVVGRVYNKTAPVPCTLPEQKTRSTWKSDTSPHEDNKFSEIFLDDAGGAEMFRVQSQRDMRKLVKRHETERVLVDRLHVVGKSRVHAVAEIDATQIGTQRLIQIVEPGDLKILQEEKPEVNPKDTFIEVKDEKITLTVGGARIVLDGPNITVVADDGIRFTAEENVLIWGGPNVYFNEKPAKQVVPRSRWDVEDPIVKIATKVAAPIKGLFNKKKQPATLERPAIEMPMPPPGPPGSQAAKFSAGGESGLKGKLSGYEANFGLATKDKLTDLAKDVLGLAANWESLDEKQRLAALEVIINKQLQKDGVPHVGLRAGKPSQSAWGMFSPSKWRISINRSLLSKPSLNVGDVRELTDTLAHEGRHVQQFSLLDRAYPGAVDLPSRVKQQDRQLPPLTPKEKALADKVHESYCVPKDFPTGKMTTSDYVRTGYNHGTMTEYRYRQLPEEKDAYFVGETARTLISPG